jgi:hypothetical protein
MVVVIMNGRKLPNLVIAGTVKAGTTALFRYLAAHPQICGSKVKETCYFLPLRYGKELSPIEQYTNQFSHCGSERYRLESTPGYFEGGKKIATQIDSTLDNARVIIMLRDPVDRLRSFYSYQKAQVNLPKDLDFSTYIEECNAIPEQIRCLQESDSYWGVDGGRYIRYLPEWYEVFGRKRLLVLFHDRLKSDPESLAKEIAAWLDIDYGDFEGRRPPRDNVTVPYRSAWLQRIAISANRYFEPISMRFPSLKRAVRNVYYAFNSSQAMSPPAATELARASKLYEEDNKELAAFLSVQGYQDLPQWLAKRV